MAQEPRLRVVGVTPNDVRTEEEVRAGVLPTNAAELPSDDAVLDSLVVNEGIAVRVAAMLNVSEEYVMGVVSRNLGALSRKLRGRVMLGSFMTVIALDREVRANAGEMPLDALGRTYAASLAAFGNLAGQFEEKEQDNDTDDAEAAKAGMLERLERMGKREAAERAVEAHEEVG